MLICFSNFKSAMQALQFNKYVKLLYEKAAARNDGYILQAQCMQCFMQNSWSVIPMNQTLKIARGLGERREGLESSGVIQNNPLPPHKKKSFRVYSLKFPPDLCSTCTFVKKFGVFGSTGIGLFIRCFSISSRLSAGTIINLVFDECLKLLINVS